MKVKKPLAYCLIIFVWLQSFAAIADVHQSHQSGEQHVAYEHDHDIGHDRHQHGEMTAAEAIFHSKAIDVNHPLPTDFDCHHCCHCHGAHPLWMVTNVTFFPSQVYSNQDTAFRFYLISGVQEKLLRPPIQSRI